MSPEEYAIQLIINGAASTAEDDLNEDGAIADGQHQEACDLALAIVRAIREDATIRAELVAAGVAQRRPIEDAAIDPYRITVLP